MVDVPHTVVHAEQLDHSILNDPDPTGPSSGSGSPRTSDRAGGTDVAEESHPGRPGDSDRDSRGKANGVPVNQPSSSGSLAGKDTGETSRDYTFIQQRPRERGEREGRGEASNRDHGGATRSFQDQGGGTRRAGRVDRDTPAPALGTAIIIKAADGGSTNHEADTAAAAGGGTGTGGGTSKPRRHRSYPFHRGGMDGDGMVTDELMMALPPHCKPSPSHILRLLLLRLKSKTPKFNDWDPF